ncbi:MAG TPA: carbohydrate ABC transporter permease, partial [Acidimicrobiales bacterium]|nr:carbohydrate ABC transporter permease [Acidimicrobiales bacterium]
KALFVAAVVVLDIPVLTVIVDAFQPSEDVSAHRIIPRRLTLSNFSSLGQLPFGRYVLNSFIVAGGGTVLALGGALFAGYAMSRFRRRSVNAYGHVLLAVQMVPTILTLLPLFLLMRDLKLINTYWSLILIYGALLLPFSSWIARAFFDSIPKELEEAGWVDGCTRRAALRRIVAPLAGPGLVSIAILSFITAWNEYLLASVFISGPDMTVSVGLQTFTEQLGPIGGAVMAGAAIAMVPSLAIYLIFQKYFVSGALAGAVKG